MSKITNVKLSENELNLVTNSEFILTKNRIISNVYELFGAVSDTQKHELQLYAPFLPPEVFNREPKIYKGEQYRELPYVMMDYPRFFTKTDVMAIRNFFWWGNFFSIGLYLSGEYQAKYLPIFWSNKNKISTAEWYVDTGLDFWNLSLDEKDNKMLNDFDGGHNDLNQFLDRPFFKVSIKMPLQNWDNAYDFFTVHYARILQMLVP